MKKGMRFTTLLASASMLCSTLPAIQASALYYWGTDSSGEFQDMTPVDDKGMFQWIGYGGVPGTPRDYQVYTQHYSRDVEEEVTYADTGETKFETTHYEGDDLYVVMPRNDILRIVMRSDLDETEAKKKAVSILREYYPEMLVDANITGFPASFYLKSDHVYELCDRSNTAGSEEVSAAIMKDMAQAGLITAFYTWGQTANYQQVWYTYPTAYNPTSRKWNSDYTALEVVTYDWDAIEAWVTTHYPECEFVRVTLEDTELAKKTGYYDYVQNRAYFGNNDKMYAVIPPDGTTFSEHLAIATDLYDQFGLAAEWTCPDSVTSPLVGQNALAVAGDVTLDCLIDVADAVLLARFCAEDAEAVITDQGKANADYNADGDITQDDVVMILQKIARLI